MKTAVLVCNVICESLYMCVCVCVCVCEAISDMHSWLYIKMRGNVTTLNLNIQYIGQYKPKM